MKKLELLLWPNISAVASNQEQSFPKRVDMKKGIREWSRLASHVFLKLERRFVLHCFGGESGILQAQAGT